MYSTKEELWKGRVEERKCTKRKGKVEEGRVEEELKKNPRTKYVPSFNLYCTFLFLDSSLTFPSPTGIVEEELRNKIRQFRAAIALFWSPYSRMGYQFRLGNNSGVDDQLDAVTSVSGRSRCSKKPSFQPPLNFTSYFEVVQNKEFELWRGSVSLGLQLVDCV
ncbi:hypothetical protein BpHYR1_004184 [Brachionus plicatilis]|uniref:Uncharacterized protein n=1 Tax=Brachionus plicatilis TaxID=10195 RepID=A0A3M7PZE5_BRAPC|nr:hypothetical protein BpHYR1_004184 [Brachionus plicatilis]